MVGEQIALAHLDRRRSDLDRIDDAKLAQVAERDREPPRSSPASRCARGPSPRLTIRWADASWPNSV